MIDVCAHAGPCAAPCGDGVRWISVRGHPCPQAVQTLLTAASPCLKIRELSKQR